MLSTLWILKKWQPTIDFPMFNRFKTTKLLLKTKKTTKFGLNRSKIIIIRSRYKKYNRKLKTRIQTWALIFNLWKTICSSHRHRRKRIMKSKAIFWPRIGPIQIGIHRQRIQVELLKSQDNNIKVLSSKSITGTRTLQCSLRRNCRWILRW